MKLYSPKELKHSRIFYEKKQPPFLRIFIYSVLVLMIILLVASTFISRPYIVRGQGTVTTKDNLYVSSFINGEIVEIIHQEGNLVKKDDIIIRLSNGEEGINIDALNSQIVNLEAMNNVYDLFEKSISEGVNYLSNSGNEQEYYGKVTYYLQIKTSENYNKTNERTDISGINSQIQTIESTIQNLNNEKNVIDYQFHLNEKNRLIEEINQLNQKIAMANDDNEKQTLSSELTTKQNELKPHEDAVNRYHRIESTLSTEQGNLDSKKKERDQYTRQLNNPQTQSGQVYAQMINELGTARNNNQTKLIELKAQQSAFENKEDVLVLKAKNDGYVHYLSPFKTGMSVQAGQSIFEVSQNERKDFEVEAYIEAKDISKVELNQPVNVSLIGVNISKYGIIKGKLKHIDSGSIVQQTNQGNQVLYRVVIELQDTQLKRKSEVIDIIKSMPVEVRVIYMKETYFDWLLKQFNFIQ